MATMHTAADLRLLAERILTGAGWSPDDAAMAAHHLILANLSGHDSHGIGMLPVYAASWREGLLKPTNTPEIVSETAPFLVMRGNLALGQPAAEKGTARAIAMAKAGGVAILNLVNAHHIGRIGHYAEMAAAAGLIGLFWVNVAGRPPVVAPFGGRKAAFGTNPHAIGIPNGDEPLILDFATSRMAQGKTRVAFNKGEQVPPGYLIDQNGAPTTDPGAVNGARLGALLPFGDHKGAGISLIAELLSAGLHNEGALIHRTAHRGWVINSLFAIIFDPVRIDPDADTRRERIASIVAHQRATPPADGIDRVRSPGDKERETRAERSRTGIAIDAETWRQLQEIARELGVG